MNNMYFNNHKEKYLLSCFGISLNEFDELLIVLSQKYQSNAK